MLSWALLALAVRADGRRLDRHPMVNNPLILHPVGNMDWHIPGFPSWWQAHK
jgi:hypothetical protein